VDVEIILPHGVGKPAKIAVSLQERLPCGLRVPVQIEFSPDEIKELGGDKRAARKLADEYKFFIAETQFMPVIGKMGPIWGRGARCHPRLPPTQDVNSPDQPGSGT